MGYEERLHIYGEAARTEAAGITIDLLAGTIIEGAGSPYLLEAARRSAETLAERCLKAGVNADAMPEAQVGFTTMPAGRRFTVMVTDAARRRSTTDYNGDTGAKI